MTQAAPASGPAPEVRPATTAGPRRGLVLSGGGAKGSFTAGAVEYLFTRAHYFPEILTGTSIGSICSGIIAQARTPAEFAQVTATLRDTILAMGTPGAAVVPQTWLQELAATHSGKEIAAYLEAQQSPPPPPDPDLDVDVLAPPAADTSRGAHNLVSLLGSMALRPHILRDMRAHDSSIMLFDPFAAALRGEAADSPIAALDLAAVARPGLEVRLTVTALNDSCIRYVDQHGAIVERDARTPAPGAPVPGVIEGMLASSSVPTIFPPRRMGDDVYVDGGIVQNIPLAPALELGADDVVVVLSEQRLCPPPTQDYATADALSVLYRAESFVAFFDQQRRDLEYADAAGAHVRLIEPIVDVVGAFDISADRMRINMDYGWLRACAQFGDLSASNLSDVNDAADRITAARARLLHFAAGEGSSHPAFAESVASARRQIEMGLATFADAGLAVPAGAEEWARFAVPAV